MKKLSIITVAAVLLAAVPATLGLSGNAAFAQSVPVRVPSQAVAVQDRGAAGTHLEVGDVRGVHRSAGTAVAGDDKTGVSTHVEAGSHKSGVGKHVEAGSHESGLSTHVEAGDDKGGLSTHVESSSHKSGSSTHVESSSHKGGSADGSGHS
jgi:hypothetical protein